MTNLMGLNSSARECPPVLGGGAIKENYLKQDDRPQLYRHGRVELRTSKTRSKSSIVKINRFRS